MTRCPEWIFPSSKNLVAPARVAAEADRAAAMIEHDPGIGKRTREIGKLADLRVKQPRIETQAQRREAGKALAKRRVEQQAFRARGVDAGHIGVRIPWRGMPDAAEAAVAGDNLCFKNRARGFAQQQIGVADDAGADRGGTVAAAGAHRGDAIGEFNLADRPQRFRPAGAIHCAAIDIDGGDDVVAGCDVGGELLDQIALAAAIPQMMMRIDDRAVGIDDVLSSQRQPVFARIGIEPAF